MSRVLTFLLRVAGSTKIMNANRWEAKHKETARNPYDLSSRRENSYLNEMENFIARSEAYLRTFKDENVPDFLAARNDGFIPENKIVPGNLYNASHNFATRLVIMIYV